MKVALVYDRLNKIGGAEHILQGFDELFPDSDWFTSVWDPGRAPFSANWKVKTSWLNKIPFLRIRHEYLPYLMPFVFESFDFTGYDLVISIGSAESKGVITRPETMHIHYCLTPTRYLYSHAKEYLNNPVYSTVGKYLRAWDQVASTRPDVMISISEHVKKRVKKYYNRKTDVIYPPVDTQKFSIDNRQLTIDNPLSPYYLIVSRLVPYKNIALAVSAFNRNGKKLVIIGTGSEMKKLRKMAKDNINFLGLVLDTELPGYYAGAKAFLQCNEEDFGIAMVESLASGRPVIAYSSGGASEIVTESTGVLYNDLSVETLVSTIEKFESIIFSASACRKRAAVFDKSVWSKKMRERVKTEWTQYRQQNRI